MTLNLMRSTATARFIWVAADISTWRTLPHQITCVLYYHVKHRRPRGVRTLSARKADIEARAAGNEGDRMNTKTDSFEDYFTVIGLTIIGWFIWQAGRMVVDELPGLMK